MMLDWNAYRDELLADLLPSHPMIAELRAIAQGGPKTSKAA